jgi:hypothetical protein
MAAKARRGMSVDEKRSVILDVFHETKEVYLLKVRHYWCAYTCVLYKGFPQSLSNRGPCAPLVLAIMLQDIERLASRRGVVLQSVKDVLQSLVDDDLVHQEKIGISNFFWSFPGEAAVKLEAEIASLTQKLEERKAYEGRLKDDLRVNLVGKEITQEKETLARQVGQLEGEIESKRRELEMYTANDPERFEALSELFH